MSRGHDPRYLAVTIPDQYAADRCGECPHFKIQHGANPDFPDARPGCWWAVMGCVCAAVD